MGFFSWITQDSCKSIPSRFSKQKTFAVTMRSPTVDYLEDNYEGYGIFGGKDYYELLAEMNPQLTLELTDNPPKRLQKGSLKSGGPTELRHVGIYMSSHHTEERLLYPQLIEDPTVEVDFHDRVADCPDQGFFYPEQSYLVHVRRGDLIMDTHLSFDIHLPSDNDSLGFTIQVTENYEGDTWHVSTFENTHPKYGFPDPDDQTSEHRDTRGFNTEHEIFEYLRHLIAQ